MSGRRGAPRRTWRRATIVLLAVLTGACGAAPATFVAAKRRLRGIVSPYLLDPLMHVRDLRLAP